MKTDSTRPANGQVLFGGEAWFDPIEAGVRGRIRSFIETMLEEELAATLGRAAMSGARARATAMAGASVSCLARSGR